MGHGAIAGAGWVLEVAEMGSHDAGWKIGVLDKRTVNFRQPQ